MKKILVVILLFTFGFTKAQSVFEETKPFLIHDVETIGTEIVLLHSEVSPAGKELLSWQSLNSPSDHVLEAVVLDSDNNELGRISNPLPGRYTSFDFTFTNNFIYGIADISISDHRKLFVYKFTYSGELISLDTLISEINFKTTISAKTNAEQKSFIVYYHNNEISGVIYDQSGNQINQAVRLLGADNQFVDFTPLPDSKMVMLYDDESNLELKLSLFVDDLATSSKTITLDFNNYNNQKSKITSDDNGNVYCILQSKIFMGEEYFTIAKYSSNLDFVDSITIPFENIIYMDKDDYDFNYKNGKIVFSFLNADSGDRIITTSILDTNLTFLSQNTEILADRFSLLHASSLSDHEISYTYLNESPTLRKMIERTITDNDGNIIKPKTLIYNNRNSTDEGWANFFITNDTANVVYRKFAFDGTNETVISQVDILSQSFKAKPFFGGDTYGRIAEPPVLKVEDRIITAVFKGDTLGFTIFDGSQNYIENFKYIVKGNSNPDFNPEFVKVGSDKFAMISLFSGENGGYFIQIFDKNGVAIGDRIPFKYNWHGKNNDNKLINEHYLESTGTLFSFVSYNHFEFLLLNEEGIPQTDTLVRAYPQIENFNGANGIAFLHKPDEVICLMYGRMGLDNIAYLISCDLNGNINLVRKLENLNIPDVYSGTIRTEMIGNNTIAFSIDYHEETINPKLLCYNLDTEIFSNSIDFFTRNDTVYLNNYKMQIEGNQIYILSTYKHNSTYREDYDLLLSKYSYDPVLGIIEETTPKDFSLSQNYPNPFNPETTIKFSLPGAGNVKIVVYNMLGEEVAILLDGVLSAGTHELNFNGRSLTSGVYFYKIESGNFRAVKKMLLLK